MAEFYIGDRVTPHKRVKGLRCGTIYVVSDVHRGIDGAVDWDDLFLSGVSGKFCEFDFKKVESA